MCDVYRAGRTNCSAACIHVSMFPPRRVTRASGGSRDNPSHVTRYTLPWLGVPSALLCKCEYKSVSFCSWDPHCVCPSPIQVAFPWWVAWCWWCGAAVWGRAATCRQVPGVDTGSWLGTGDRRKRRPAPAAPSTSRGQGWEIRGLALCRPGLTAQAPPDHSPGHREDSLACVTPLSTPSCQLPAASAAHLIDSADNLQLPPAGQWQQCRPRAV